MVGARVSVMRDGCVVASSRTNEFGTCFIDRDTDHQQTVRVEAPGLVTENRVIPIGVHNRNELFLLGLPGMSFYYQGRLRVPSGVPVTPRPRHLWGLVALSRFSPEGTRWYGHLHARPPY